MAASTGPDSNLYQIPEVELGDTFNVWRDTTNTQTYKLNKMKVYDGVSSSTIEITVSGGGTLTAVLADNIGKGVTFLNPVVFSSGVTFNGDVTFNATTFTVNASVVTIDDYSIILGDTAAASDTAINTVGGGGLILKRGGGATAEWLWRGTEVHGITGAWQANAHIGFSGATWGLLAHQYGVLPVHGSGLRIDGGGTAEHGIAVTLSTDAGTTTERRIDFARYSPAGSTAFMSISSGLTHANRPFVKIRDGANRKVVAKNTHNFAFGTPVRADGSDWAAAQGDNAENAEVVGIVSEVIDTNTFELTFIGEIFGNFTSVTEDGNALSAGRTYYLSPYNSGKITQTQPTASGSVHKAVLVATSSTSAVVLPFTGGVLASPLSIANASSVSTQINQINRFKLGDIVRFKEYVSAGGVTLAYSIGSGQTLEAFYTDGIYVKAQANSAAEAEIAGMVVGLNGATGSGTQAYESFNILMDGFFDLAGLPSSLSPGSVYFLSSSSIGTSGAFESAAVSYSTSEPTTEGSVRKPLFMATGAGTGYLFSYRGDVRGAVTGVSYANLDDFLVQKILSGTCGDLVIGVYNASSGGKETIRLATGSEYDYFTSRGACGGYMGVGGGWASWNSGGSSTNKILANLDLNGTLRVGKTLGSTPVGQDLIVARNTGDANNGVTMESRLVIGLDYNDSSLVIGRGVRPKPGAIGYNSSIGSAIDRSALVIGASGNAGPSLRWRTAANNTTAVGGNVALADVFSIVGTESKFTANLGVTGGTVTVTPSTGGGAAAILNGGVNIYPNTTTTTVGLRIYEDADTAGYLRFRPTSGTQNGFVFSDDGDQPILTVDSLNDRIGVNTSTPTAALDVTGALKVSGQITHGTAPMAAPSGSAPLFAARAWGRFVGGVSTNASDVTVSGVLGGNIASVTRSAAGIYDVTFTTNMTDTNYAIIVVGSNKLDGRGDIFPVASSKTVTGFQLRSTSIGDGSVANIINGNECFFAVFA